MIERNATVTERLYEADSSLTVFTASVLSCKEERGGFAVVLDRTAFFPTGGGQPHDEGALNGIPVRGVFIDGDRILHLTDEPFLPGETVTGRIDAPLRRRRMASHTAEHLVSAVMARRFGLTNVGFRLGSHDVTCDFDGVIAPSALITLEEEVNALIRENHPVTARYPSESELSSLSYRSKLALTGAVRIVFIGKDGGVDRCACCAPHVSFTGEIGLLRVVHAEPWKGGLRLHLLAGADALAHDRRESDCLSSLSVLLSAKPDGDSVAQAAERLFRENETRKKEIEGLNGRINALLLDALSADADLCLFDDRSDRVALRRLASEAAERFGRPAAVFGAADPDGSRPFVIAAESGLRPLWERLKARLPLNGGGSDRLISGTAAATGEDLRSAVSDCLRETAR